MQRNSVVTYYQWICFYLLVQILDSEITVNEITFSTPRLMSFLIANYKLSNNMLFHKVKYQINVTYHAKFTNLIHDLEILKISVQLLIKPCIFL
jgi:hypothetical protein